MGSSDLDAGKGLSFATKDSMVEGRVFKCVNTERARRGGFKQNGTDSPRNRAVEQFTYAADPIERLEVLGTPLGNLQRPFYWKFPYIQLFLFNPLKNNIVVFPTNKNLEKIRTPIMILHAEDDHIVPFAMAQEIYRIAKKAQKSDERVKLVPFDGSLGYLHNGLYKDPGLPNIKRFLYLMI
ncbi:monoacylglycerol lipase ABHD12 [Pimephales promelas]|nr:monoacylglycerol lipase ABHD12 [Pimephales promelas]KAG1950872.1 monoacylglycerol lipase ABHD12 [Pimephales promelas]KAG1950873.1 monoacylglycerol lipase ABHD12 [Pimephales promelas]